MLPPLIKAHIEELLETDKVFQKSGVQMPDFSWRTHEAIFPSLMRTIVGQQLSTKAANSIWQRVADGVGDLSHTGFAKVDDETLRGYGLSRPKISYVRGLADAVANKTFDPELLWEMNDEEAIAHITALKGFGEWSAHMILIFTLSRHDIWPTGDLAIREGVKVYKKLDERPDIPTTLKFGNKFKGKRTALSLLLWKLQAIK